MKTKCFFAPLAAAGLALAAAFAPSALHAASPVELRVELDRSVLPANTKDKAVIKISLDGLRLERRENRPPVNLAMVLDRSGSMNGEKIIQAREAAIEAVRRLATDDIVSLIAFDDRVETLIPATRVGDLRNIEERIRRIQPGNSTALHAGVSQGAAELRENLTKPGYIHRIILLSDGQANVGPETPEQLGALGVKLVKDGISVTTVGLGLGYDEDLMTKLALKSDGNTYFVKNARDLPDIFKTELGDVLNVVARRVAITIEFPEGVRPVRFVGREGTIKGQSAELTINQIYGGQEKFALVEVEIPTVKDGTERDLARVNVAFENTRSQTVEKSTVVGRARFSADKNVVLKSANQRVQADYASNLIAVAKDEAIVLADAGKVSEAAALMRLQSATLNSGYFANNTVVAELASKNTADADSLEAKGLDNAARKDYRATNANTYLQQAVTYPGATK
ncbi:MAG: VWA domain-containing protein [Puniceicoccales bacterium]|jgi:Ca-activated chloride channel family protein|nr:VWA domain-containing protein [Puniceicoccales bacterium]